MMHISLLIILIHSVYHLGCTRRTKCSDSKGLSFSSLEDRTTVSAWKNTYFATDRPDILGFSSIDTHTFFKDILSKPLLESAIKSIKKSTF